MVFLSLEQEVAAAGHAFDILKNQSGWASVQERLASANLRHSQKSEELRGVAARRREGLRHFSFQAITYIDLVKDSATADAFCNLLPLFIREAYVFSCGFPPQVMRPASQDATAFEKSIEFRFRRWTTKAYQRAQRKSPQQTEGASKRVKSAASPESDPARGYEQERAAAYRDFYSALEALSKLPFNQVIGSPRSQTADAEVDQHSPHQPPQLPSRFEQVLFTLYERIVVAYKRRLVAACLPTSEIILKLAEHFESLHHEIYVARLVEFEQRAGSYATNSFPEPYLFLLPVNARGHTSQLFRTFEDEVLAADKLDPSVEPVSRDSKSDSPKEAAKAEIGKTFSTTSALPASTSPDGAPPDSAAPSQPESFVESRGNPLEYGLTIPGTDEYRRAFEGLKQLREAEEADPELRQKHQKEKVDLQALCARFLGRNPPAAERQEELIRDARKYAEAHLLEAGSTNARNRITKKIWDEFIPRHSNAEDFKLGFAQLHAAIWTEGYPTLEERASRGDRAVKESQTRDGAGSANPNPKTAVEVQAVEPQTGDANGQDREISDTTEGDSKGHKVPSHWGRQPLGPQFWAHFSLEKTSKTSIFRDLLVYGFASLSIPKGSTNRDVVEQIAKQARIPIESLPEELNGPVFSRAVVIFGHAGDEFDNVARDYENLQWWVSDAGLNMATVAPLRPPRFPTFDELAGELVTQPPSADLGAAHAPKEIGPPKGSIERNQKPEGSRGRSLNNERLGLRLKNLKARSKLPWRTIAAETGISYRWLLDIQSGHAPSPEIRKAIRDYFARVLQRPIRF